MSNHEQTPAELRGMDRDTLATFREVARCIDAEVAKGRDVDNVLAEHLATPSPFFSNPEVLQHFSAAVADTFKSSPIPLRMSQPMRVALEKEVFKSKLPRSEVMRQMLQESLVKRGYQLGV